MSGALLAVGASRGVGAAAGAHPAPREGRPIGVSRGPAEDCERARADVAAPCTRRVDERSAPIPMAALDLVPATPRKTFAARRRAP